MTDDELKNLVTALRCGSALARHRGDKRVSIYMANAADAVVQLREELSDVLANSERRDLNRRIMMQRRQIRTMTVELKAKDYVIEHLRAELLRVKK